MSPEISRAHLSVSRPGSAKGGESILEKVRLSRHTEYIEPICKNYSEIFGICNNDFPVHIHDDIEIVHILSGDRMAIIESREYYEPEGSLTVIFPFQRHGYRTLNGGQHNVICIDPQYLFGYSERLFSFMPSDPVLRADELGERAAALLSVIMDRSRPRDKVQTNALITALLPELFGPLGLRQRADFSLSGEILPLVMEHCREPSFSLLALSRYHRNRRADTVRLLLEELRHELRKLHQEIPSESCLFTAARTAEGNCDRNRVRLRILERADL